MTHLFESPPPGNGERERANPFPLKQMAVKTAILFFTQTDPEISEGDMCKKQKAERSDAFV